VDTVGWAERLYYRFHAERDVIDFVGGLFRDVRPGARILDFGGGGGRVAAALREELHGALTIADVDREALGGAARRGLRAVLVPAAPALPFASDRFDRILLVDALHHVASGAETLAELRRCLAPGGRLHIVDYDARRALTTVFGFLLRLQRRRCLFWTPDRLAAALGALGLQVQVTPLDALRYCVTGHRA